MDLAGCRHGGAIDIDSWIGELGLKHRPIRVGFKTIVKNLPVVLTVINPHVGTSLHSVLVVGATVKDVDLVNFRWLCGPVVERLRWSDVPMMPPGNVNRRAWRIVNGP